MKTKNKAKGAFFASLSSAFYGFTNVLGTLLTEKGISVPTYFAVSCALGGLAAALMALFRGESLRIRWKDLGKMVILNGFGAIVTNYLLLMAAEYLPNGVVITVHYLYPAVTAALEWFLFRETADRRLAVTFLIALGGIMLLCESIEPSNLTGLFYVLPTTLTWSFFLIYIEKSGLDRLNDSCFLFWSSLVQAALSVLIGAVTRTDTYSLIAPFSLYFIFIGLINCIIGQILLNLAIEHTGAAFAAVFGVFEPVSAMINGAIILGDELSPLHILSCAIVIGGILFYLLSVSERNGE